MKLYEKYHIPAREDTRCIRRKCDLCGLESSTSHWEGSTWEVLETKLKVSVVVSCRTGESFPEGGMGTAYDIDICPGCFQKRLVPWFRNQGADIKETEWDF